MGMVCLIFVVNETYTFTSDCENIFSYNPLQSGWLINVSHPNYDFNDFSFFDDETILL